MNKNNHKEFRKGKYVLRNSLITGALFLCIATGLYAYRNLNYDYDGSRFMEEEGRKLGFSEKQIITPDGSSINYLEGPDNGQVLVLLHGQQVDSKDYRSVLPELSSKYRIFCIDYYGHGGSSKDVKKYSIQEIGKDTAWFIKNVIGEKAIVSGHSSGALITAYIAAYYPEHVKAVILEDGPFFSTEPHRIQDTIAGKDFIEMKKFLAQNEVRNYTLFYLDNNYMKNMFNKDGKDNWSFLVADPARRILRKNPDKLPVIWYFPPGLGINQLLSLNGNIQDGTGDYDLRFGARFADGTWFGDLDQEEMLSRIECPALIMHVAPPDATAPGYYLPDGTLISAMDEKDAKRVHELIKGSTLKTGFKSSHDIHMDRPAEFIESITEFIESSGI